MLEHIEDMANTMLTKPMSEKDKVSLFGSRLEGYASNWFSIIKENSRQEGAPTLTLEFLKKEFKTTFCPIQDLERFAWEKLQSQKLTMHTPGCDTLNKYLNKFKELAMSAGKHSRNNESALKRAFLGGLANQELVQSIQFRHDDSEVDSIEEMYERVHRKIIRDGVAVVAHTTSTPPSLKINQVSIETPAVTTVEPIQPSQSEVTNLLLQFIAAQQQ